MSGRILGVPDALHLAPLLHGLDGPFELQRSSPAQLAVDFRERPGTFRGAFLSPLDYARHGGNYQIIPGICVASSVPSGTISLYINKDRKNITSLAADVRHSSEIILARLILLERFSNTDADAGNLTLIPATGEPEMLLEKADAALLVNPRPAGDFPSLFSLDLVDEWRDMTGLPFVHGMWIVRENDFTEDEAALLLQAKERGVELAERDPSLLVKGTALGPRTLADYFSAFSYTLDDDCADGISEFFRLAYFHGILGDVPDLNFFESPPPSRLSVN